MRAGFARAPRRRVRPMADLRRLVDSSPHEAQGDAGPGPRIPLCFPRATFLRLVPGAFPRQRISIQMTQIRRESFELMTYSARYSQPANSRR